MKKDTPDSIFSTPSSIFKKAIKLKITLKIKKKYPMRIAGSIISVVIQLTMSATNPKTIKMIDHILKGLFI